MLAVLTFAVVQLGRGGSRVAPAFVLAGALLLAFLATEARNPEPILPVVLFRRPAFSVANAVAGAMNAPFGVGRRRRDASAVRAAVCARPSRRSAYCPGGP